MCDRCSFPFVAKFVVCDCEMSLCEACAKMYNVHPSQTPQEEWTVEVYLPEPAPFKEEPVGDSWNKCKERFWYRKVNSNKWSYYKVTGSSVGTSGYSTTPLMKIADCIDGKIVPCKPRQAPANISWSKVVLKKYVVEQKGQCPREEETHELRPLSDTPNYKILYDQLIEIR